MTIIALLFVIIYCCFIYFSYDCHAKQLIKIGSPTADLQSTHSRAQSRYFRILIFLGLFNSFLVLLQLSWQREY